MQDKSEPESRFKLFRRRLCLVPTGRGWVLILLLLCCAGLFLVRTIYPFLAPNHPIPSSILVLEGWVADEGMKQVITMVHEGPYQRVFITGGPLEYGSALSSYGNFADAAAASLARLGLERDKIQAVPSPAVMQDRTYTSALALKSWMEAHGGVPAAFNLISVGPHARRSRLLFQKAFGKQIRIGTIVFETREYDPFHWWKSSAGVRQVLDESIAYLYARFLFWPGAPDRPLNDSGQGDRKWPPRRYLRQPGQIVLRNERPRCLQHTGRLQRPHNWGRDDC
jgi:hypothetical protein